MKSNIHERALQNAQQFNFASRDLFAILVEVDQTRAFEDHQYTHLIPYCINFLKIDPDIAKTLVRIVRKSIHVPELAQAVSQGELHISKAKAICSVITPENQQEWITKAKRLSKAQLEKEISKHTGYDKKKLTLDLPLETFEKLNRARDIASTKAAEFVSLETTIAKAIELYLFKNDPVEPPRRLRMASRL